MSPMTFQLMIVALVLIAICIELLFLILSVIRVAKATERVGRILGRPRKARAELQDELDQIAQAAASGAATVEDMKRADVIADQLSRNRPTLD
jgi:biopolymer transport protein ExbB/TolQ